MNPRFTDLFVRRPVLALVVSAVMLLVGLQAGTQLTLRQYPEVEKSVIFVNTSYPGASAETVQGSSPRRCNGASRRRKASSS